MYGSIKSRLNEQFQLEETRGQCLRPRCAADRRALGHVTVNVSGEKTSAYLRSGREVPEYVSVFPNLYLRGIYWLSLREDELALHIIRALSAQHPDWIFCSTSAALLHGLDISWELLDAVHITCKHGGSASYGGRLIRHAYPVGTLRSPGGIRAVDAREAVLECLCTVPFELSLGIVDSFLRLFRFGKSGLEAYFDVMGKGRKGIARAHATLSYADARAENGGESRARAVMIEEGYAPHELQVPFADPLNPSHVMRGDLGWLLEIGQWIIGELDGREKYENPLMMNGGDITDVMMAERMRESRLSAYGAQIMRFPFSYVVDRWNLVHLMQIFGVPRSEIPIIP